MVKMLLKYESLTRNDDDSEDDSHDDDDDSGDDDSDGDSDEERTAFKCNQHLFYMHSSTATTITTMYTYIMALAELGACYEGWAFPPHARMAGLFKACLELDIPFQDGKVLVEEPIKYGNIRNDVDYKARNQFTLCLDSGVDVMSQLWQYDFRNDSHCLIIDGIMLAFIEMGALDVSLAPANISETLFPVKLMGCNSKSDY